MAAAGAEITDNIFYMKLLHELKAAFPAVPDELVRHYISQFGKDKDKCVEALSAETQRTLLSHGHSYAASRVPHTRRLSLQQNQGRPFSPLSSSSKRSEDSNQEPYVRSRALPIGLQLPVRSRPCKTRTIASSRSSSDSAVPMVVLTPESPPRDCPEQCQRVRTLYNPCLEEDPADDDVVLFGHATSLTATCVDIDMESLASSSSSTSSADDPLASVSTATLSQGAVHVMKKGSVEPVVSTSFTSVTVQSGSVYTANSNWQANKAKVASNYNNNNYNNNNNNANCTRENPYRKVFVKRKQFYQQFSSDNNNEEDQYQDSKLIWRRHCSLCNSEEGQHQNKHQRITLNANIQPFAPFVIQHDENDGHILTNNDSQDSVMRLSADERGELRYATSHSEDGVESHLEVSLGKDGSVITTTHKRLGGSSSSHQGENSVLQVHYGDGGKVLNIRQSLLPSVSQKRPNSLNLKPTVMSGHNKQRPNSAYCTQLVPTNTPYCVLRYNSLPNLYGRRPVGQQICDVNTQAWPFNTHPADEEKRLAYTRALLSHQMEQRMKLEKELLHGKRDLHNIQENVRDLETQLNLRNKFLQSGQIDNKITEFLAKDVTNLQQKCDNMAEEVTKLTKGNVPLGETNIDFYESLPAVLEASNSGSNLISGQTSPYVVQTQSAPTTPKSSSSPKKTASTSTTTKNDLNLVTSSTTSTSHPDMSGDSGELQWACTACTFLNHPALKNCEECEMARFVIESPEQPDVGILAKIAVTALPNQL